MLRIFVRQTAWQRPPQPQWISVGAGDQRASRRSLLLMSFVSYPASKGRAVPRWRKQAAHSLRGSSFCTPLPPQASRILEQKEITTTQLLEQVRDRSVCSPPQRPSPRSPVTIIHCMVMHTCEFQDSCSCSISQPTTLLLLSSIWTVLFSFSV